MQTRRKSSGKKVWWKCRGRQTNTSTSLSWLAESHCQSLPSSPLFHLSLFSSSNPPSNWQGRPRFCTVLFALLMAPSLLQSPAHQPLCSPMSPALASEADRDSRPSCCMPGFAKPSMTDLQFAQPFHCSQCCSFYGRHFMSMTPLPCFRSFIHDQQCDIMINFIW